MSAIQIDDGLWQFPGQDGPWRYAFPFQSRGDGISFEARRTMKQNGQNFVRPTNLMQSMGFPQGTAYMVESTPTRYDDCGILEWEETFASVPQQRSEPQSIVYEFQFLYTPVNYNPADASGVFPLPDPPSTSGLTKIISATVTYNYSLTPFATKEAPRVVVLFDRLIITFANWGKLAAGQTILAEDAENQIYRAGIYQQKLINFVVPSYQQLFS